MSPRPSNPARELLALYSRAGRAEHNLGAFLREHPDVHARFGHVDLEGDDSHIALQLAPAIGRYRRDAARLQASTRGGMAKAAAQELADSAHHRDDAVELDVTLVLGELLNDSSNAYVSFELFAGRVSIFRSTLLRARSALRGLHDVRVFADEDGLHFRWRDGRGGLNLRPQVERPGAASLAVDLRPPVSRRHLSRPLSLADVLTDLGLM